MLRTVQETLTLEFVFTIGQYVRVADDVYVSEFNEWAKGIPLVVMGYLAQGDEEGDDFFYRCQPANKNDIRTVFLREEDLKPIRIKGLSHAPAKAA